MKPVAPRPLPSTRQLARAACLTLLLFLALGHASAWAAKPNIIFILTDDQGYGDLSCHGNPILKTPNLDRLHNESVRFTDFHVSPTCAPTRAALLTGRHEFKSGVTHTIHERERLALDAVTLPQALKSAGYATGIFGKWHLGDEPAYQPGQRGFDEVFIHGGGGIGQKYPGSCGDAPGNTYFDPAILHNGRFEKTRGYCTDVFFGQALDWIAQRAKTKEPFYCHLATNAPHEPLQCRPEDEARYTSKVPPKVAKFFGMIANIDDNTGKLLARLEELGIAKDTLVVFMNDNGGTAGVPLWNAGMRGTKVTPWLGGTRAASFWRWPGTLVPRDCPALAAHLDFFPTLAELAGATLDGKTQSQIEGRSLAPLLRDSSANSKWPERVLFTHVGRWPKGANANDYKYGSCSVRDPRWHLVMPGEGRLKREESWQLFDVLADPGEKSDVANEHPEIVKRLNAAYDAWWESVVPATLENELARGPSVNPFQALYEKQWAEDTSPQRRDTLSP